MGVSGFIHMAVFSELSAGWISENDRKMKISLAKHTHFTSLPSAMKLRLGNIFTDVCQSFCSQEEMGVWKQTAPSPRRTPPWADIPRVGSPGQTLPSAATAADGRHPTGMHSCCYCAYTERFLARVRYYQY